MNEEWLKRLTEYGMDWNKTLERFSGNEELLLRFLRRFRQDTTMEEISAAERSQDAEALQRHVHNLKGISGNLGLTPLHEAAAEAMAVLRAGDTQAAAQWYAKLKQAYVLTLAVLSET